MGTPLVSVMMPAYNAEKYIEQAIHSLQAQTYSNWELIVVNDGSTDRTVELLEQILDQRIHLFHQPNAGEASARKTALAHMGGEIITFLDPDDLYLPEHLSVIVQYFIDHP